MTFWTLTSNSDFPTDQTFHNFHDRSTKLGLHRITSGFHGVLATGVACQQGMLTFRTPGFVPFWGLHMFWLSRPVFMDLHQFYVMDTELDHRITRSFHGAFATGVPCKKGALPLPDTWLPPLWGLTYAPIVETSFAELAVSFLNFSPWKPISTFSISLLWSYKLFISKIYLRSLNVVSNKTLLLFLRSLASICIGLFRHFVIVPYLSLSNSAKYSYWYNISTGRFRSIVRRSRSLWHTNATFLLE